MTVEELIAKLKAYPPGLEVVIDVVLDPRDWTGPWSPTVTIDTKTNPNLIVLK